jgi:hypothetical protein
MAFNFILSYNGLMKKLLLFSLLSLGFIGCSTNANYVLDSLGPWEHNDRTLPYESFVKEWLSGDNFDAFYKYDVGDDFRESPGKYFGKEIPSLEGIVPSWDSNDIVYISVPLNTLDYDKKTQEGYQNKQRGWSEEKINLKDKGVYFKTTEPHFLETYYTVIGLIDKALCLELAPNIKGECVDSRIVYFEDDGGGTIGPQSAIAIFGLFQLENKKEYMVPLKYLKHKMVKKYINK